MDERCSSGKLPQMAGSERVGGPDRATDQTTGAPLIGNRVQNRAELGEASTQT